MSRVTWAGFGVAAILVVGCSKGQSDAERVAPPPPSAPAMPDAAETYGDGLRGATSVSISEILSDPTRYEGQLVRIEGPVTDVCPMRGCWFDVAARVPSEGIRFKVKDGVMEFPTSAVGKYAVAEGVVTVKQLTLDETRRYAAHLAEEKGEAFDAATITEAETLVQLAGTGAVIRDAESPP